MEIPIDWEHVALIVAAVLGTGGVGGLLGYKVKWRKQQADAWASHEQEWRSNFETMVESLQDEMKRLKEAREATVKEFAEYKGRTETKIEQLERENERQAAELRALTSRVCPWGRVDCPRAPASIGGGGGGG